MKNKVLRMARVAHVRLLQEKQCEAGLMREQAMLNAAEKRVSETLGIAEATTHEMHGAMVSGDRAHWTLAEELRDFAVRSLPLLHERRVRSAEEVVLHQRRLLASRIEKEQAELLVQVIREQIQKEEERRAQATSDDRFAARQSWTARQANLKAS